MQTAAACAGTVLLMLSDNAVAVIRCYVSSAVMRSLPHSALTTFGKADMRRRAAPIGISVRSVSVVLRSAHFTGSWSVMPVESYPHEGI